MQKNEEFDWGELINRKVTISKEDIDDLLNNLSNDIEHARYNIKKHPGIAHLVLQNIVYKTNNLHRYIEELKKTPLER